MVCDPVMQLCGSVWQSGGFAECLCVNGQSLELLCQRKASGKF